MILVSNGCSAHSRRECWCVVYGYLCSCIPFLLFTNYSSIFVLRVPSLSLRIKYFCFRFLTLFFSHLFLFASSPKKNRKNCLTNTLVVLLLMLFSLSLSLSLPVLPSSSNYLSRFHFYYTQVFIFVFLQSTVHKSGDFCFCLLQLDVK